MITIIDYGLGNLRSIQNMLRRIGYQSTISSDPNEIKAANGLILPGVGAFDHGMKNISQRGLRDVLDYKALEEKVPVLGICLGMQLLASSSEEGIEPGLGWIPGKAIRFRFEEENKLLKVPHMGWNSIRVVNESPLSNGFDAEMRFYFVHSYHVICEDRNDVILEAEYGGPVAAGIKRGNIMGTQFHPEKSHKYGMRLLSNFIKLCT
jgi:glutamine amidotransferase